LKKILISIILFFGLFITNAQTLTVTTDKNPALVGEQILIKFTVNAKAKDFKSPNFQGLRILSGPNSSSSSSYSFVNGESKSEITTTYSYYVSASKEGNYTISSASVNANKKTISSNPLTIKVVKGKKQENNNIEKNLFITVNTTKKNIIVGEQIIVSYKLHTRLELENTELSQLPNLNGFWKKDLESSSRFKREVIDGIPYNTAIIKKTVLTAQKSGKLEIDPIKVTCSIRITNQRNRRDPFANFFNTYNVKEEIISSKKITINVKDLPSPKPSNFSGGVGNFEISSKTDKNELNANDALTYTIKLTGTGNIELIKPFIIDFPKDFEVYDPKITEKIFQGGNKRSIKTFEYLLIPRYKGDYKIPSYNFSFFDTKQKKYVTKKTQVHNINVLKSNNDEGNITSFSQQKIESINNDINYIKNSTIFSEKTNQTISLNVLYFLFFLPLILMVLLSIILSVRNKNPLNLIDKKHKLAKKIASKRLKKANEFLNTKNYDRFYEEIEKSLWGYFSDKFKVDIINLSKDSINDYFTKHQISKDVKNQFIDLINRCELERYSPVSNKSEQVNSLLSEAEKIIINVEAELK
tara:strand:+ start:149 stop:1897 length:1749 start_codon:yes stop_codon:yes gene_type:complete